MHRNIYIYIIYVYIYTYVHTYETEEVVHNHPENKDSLKMIEGFLEYQLLNMILEKLQIAVD